MNSDFKDLLRIFNEHKVRYLVVGGYAVIKYTEPRYTKDLDVWVDASPKNARVVFAALQKFGAPLTNLRPEDFAREGSVYQMGRPPARVDILTSIEGVQFGKAWLNRVASNFEGISAHVISRQDLLLHKQAAGRPQDLVDVSNLLEAERALQQPTDATKSQKRLPRGKSRETKR
jgi:hypothetical protein